LLVYFIFVFIWKFVSYLIFIHPNILFKCLCYNIVFLYIDISSGGADHPRPPSHDSSGKGTTAKKKLYVVRLLPPRVSLPSSTPSPFSVSITVRPPDLAPTPSPPLTEARPSSSHVDAHGLSLVPTSTPSLSLIDAHEPSPVSTSIPSHPRL